MASRICVDNVVVVYQLILILYFDESSLAKNWCLQTVEEPVLNRQGSD